MFNKNKDKLQYDLQLDWRRVDWRRRLHFAWLTDTSGLVAIKVQGVWRAATYVVVDDVVVPTELGQYCSKDCAMVAAEKYHFDALSSVV